MSKKQWVDNKGTFSFGEIPSVHKTLPLGVYELGFDGFKSIFILDLISSEFQLPGKIYDLELDFINRVFKTYKSLNKNFGVLLKGLKGTGKTIIAKLICNHIKLPVILVTKPWNDMASFINSIDQDIIVVFDEFEKIYEFYSYSNEDTDEAGVGSKQNISNLLMLMDGVFTSSHKRLFLMTTNREYLPDTLLSRPSRIRYIKDFSDLRQESILEILNDTVNNKKLIPGLVNILKGYENITVDIVKSMADEANIYNTNDVDFFSIFNVKKADVKYDIFEIIKGEEKIVAQREEMKLEQIYEENWFQFGRKNFGRVISHDYDKKTVVTSWQTSGTSKKPSKTIERTFVYRESELTHYVFG